ncbi:MAG: methyltransferase domain-containing protein [Planctomycetota bacterium]
MNKLLNQLICCPDCKSGLSEWNGALECKNCRATFALEDDIPLLFSQEISQDPLYQAYKNQYDEDLSGQHEHDSKHVQYMEMGLLEKLGYHATDYRTALHTWNSARKHARRLSTCGRFIGPTAGLSVLDIGASEGILLSALDGNRVAFDISPSHLKHIRTKDILRVSGFAETLPFKDEVFDRVVFIFLFEHLLKPEETAREITRVLKPSGKAILGVPFDEDTERLFELVESESQELAAEFSQRGDKKSHKPPTLHLRNFESIEDLTRFFPELKLTNSNYYFYKRRRRFPKWLKTLLRPFRWAPDSVKKTFPSAFAPSMLQVELTR